MRKTTTAFLFALAPTFAMAQDVDAGARMCSKIIETVNTLVDFTETACLPSASTRKPGAISFIVIPDKPIMKSEDAKKGWVIVVVAAVALASRSESAATDEVVYGDPEQMGRRFATALKTSDARALQSKIVADQITLDQMWAEIIRLSRPFPIGG